MNRTKQKQVKLGVQLFISRDKGKAGTYELIEGFFRTQYEAERHRSRFYPQCAFRVRGLRMNCIPVVLETREQKDLRVFNKNKFKKGIAA